MADWLELKALTAADRIASAADLRRMLNAVGGDDGIATGRRGDRADSQDEIYTIDALTECSDRQRSCGDAYPFEIDGALLKTKADQERSWAYIFCLLLSLKGANRGEAEDSPTALFEDVSEIAARSYVSGKSVKFGFPRKVLPKNFTAALDEVCRQLGEGQQCKARPSARTAKDARLDIVAWRPFPDKRPAQFLLFGQCAAGGNWDEKLSELQPRDFTDLYWVDPPLVTPVKGFFTPFRLALDGWEVHAKHGGILFERCRIAHLTSTVQPPLGVVKWSNETLQAWER